MDKKIILASLLSFTLGLCVMFFWHVGSQETPKESNMSPLYTYLGNSTDTTYQMMVPVDGVYTHHLIPDDVKKNGVIPNAEYAAKLAYVLIPRIYDSDCLKKEIPFQIKLVNDRVWSIRGSLPPNMLGGTFCLLLDKHTGGLIMVSHGK